MTKRINISIPKDKEQLVQEFNERCLQQGDTRSAIILLLMDDWLIRQQPQTADVVAVPEWVDDDPSSDDVLPEWLR